LNIKLNFIKNLQSDKEEEKAKTSRFKGVNFDKLKLKMKIMKVITPRMQDTIYFDASRFNNIRFKLKP
jgi:hypothetical protein